MEKALSAWILIGESLSLKRFNVDQRMKKASGLRQGTSVVRTERAHTERNMQCLGLGHQRDAPFLTGKVLCSRHVCQE